MPALSRPRRGLVVRTGSLLAGFAWLVAAERIAAADVAPSIRVVDGGSPELTRKVRAEALQAGFGVTDAAADLEGAGAVAVVRIVSRELVELYVQRAGAEGGFSEALVRRTGEGDAFALRVVEALRAHLTELRIQEAAKAPPSRAPVPTPGTPGTLGQPVPAGASGRTPEAEPSGVRGRATEDAARLWINGGLGATLPAGGLGATYEGVLGVRLEPGADWGVSVLAALPLTQNEVAGPEGEASVSVNWFALGLTYLPVPSQRWFVTAGAGAGLLALEMRAEAIPPRTGKADRLLSGLYYVDASAGRRFGESVRVQITAFGGTSAPRPVLRFDGREAASWGRWFGALALRVEVALSLAKAAP